MNVSALTGALEQSSIVAIVLIDQFLHRLVFVIVAEFVGCLEPMPKRRSFRSALLLPNLVGALPNCFFFVPSHSVTSNRSNLPASSRQ
jgi:hypothetical protein